MPICIVGMHRSGTSMVARLLNLCGLYLGPETEISAAGALDNNAGFWENTRFVKLNEAALAQLGGGWDLPPNVTQGWELDAQMIQLRSAAARLISQFDAYEIWGWKDPRNSIMLPFWKSLIPGLKIVVCLRNPLEVAQSLQKRGYSSLAFGLNLWLTYNRRLLSSTQPAERVITHYNTYFYNPRAELQRVLSLQNMPISSEAVEQACSTISERLRHSWATTQELIETKIPCDVLDFYRRMCGEAGAIYDAYTESNSETGG